MFHLRLGTQVLLERCLVLSSFIRKECSSEGVALFTAIVAGMCLFPGFNAIYTRMPAASQGGAPVVNVAHNFEKEPWLHVMECHVYIGDYGNSMN